MSMDDVSEKIDKIREGLLEQKGKTNGLKEFSASLKGIGIKITVQALRDIAEGRTGMPSVVHIQAIKQLLIKQDQKDIITKTKRIQILKR